MISSLACQKQQHLPATRFQDIIAIITLVEDNLNKTAIAVMIG